MLEQYKDKDIDQDKLREIVQEEILTEKILDWLQANATVELVPEGTLSKTPAVEEDESDEDEEEVESQTEAE